MYNSGLKKELLAWMLHSTEKQNQNIESDFSALALRLWTDQIERNPEYGRWSAWRMQGKRPQRWQDIPAVPVTLFRDLSLTCFPPMLARHHFKTSGTTGPRGSHRLLDTEVYDHGSVWGRNYIIGSVPTDGVSLVSTSTESSLGHMCRYFAPEMHQCFIPEIGVLKQAAFEHLRNVTTAQFIPATAFAMASLLADVNNSTLPIELESGSTIMITGGFKGRTQAIDERELIARLRHLFPTANIVGEYGMTELSSQMWCPTLESHFQAPPWLKVVAVDPRSGLALPNGHVGQLKFVDLANHQTVLAIETRDQGIVHSDGSMELLGRMPQSDARGCSLSVEEVDRFFVAQKKPTTVNRTLKKSETHNNTRAFDSVLNSLQTLRTWSIDEVHEISQGLSKNTALLGWERAIDSILANDSQRLHQMLQDSEYRPKTIGIVLARGVYTAGLEWTALALASGAAVHLKLPSGSTQTVQQWIQVFQANDLPITFDDSRHLPEADWLWVFGEDDNIRSIQSTVPHAHMQSYGHRFSFAISTDDPIDVKRVAQDIIAYDTRGCMAPVAICCTGNATRFAERLFDELRALEQTYPLGSVDPYLGPEFRRRIGLAVQQPESSFVQRDPKSIWGVLLQSSNQFTPSALPRLISVYSTPTPEDIDKMLHPWAQKVSTIGCSKTLEQTKWVPPTILENNPRVCELGEMQFPPFGRLHDGIPMWPKNGSLQK